MENITSLDKIKTNGVAIICKIEGLEKRKHKRLLELGFTSKTKVKVIKKNNLAKLIMLGIRGYTICMDFNMAKCIFVVEERQCKK